MPVAHSPVPDLMSGCSLSGIDDWCETWATIWDDPIGHPCHCAYAGDQQYIDVALRPGDDIVYVLGTSYEAATNQFSWAITALTRDGKVKWIAHHPGSRPAAITTSPDGTLVYATGMATDTQAATVAYDSATGQERWSHAVPNAIGKSLVVSPDGRRVYVAGYAASQNNLQDALVLAYDGVTGQPLWEERRDHTSAGASAPSKDMAWKALLDASGTRLYVINASAEQGAVSDQEIAVDGDDIVIDAYDVGPVGAPVPTPARQLWTARYKKRGYDVTLDMSSASLSADGSRIFLEATAPSNDNTAHWNAALTLAFDTATGALSWGQRYEPEIARGDPQASGQYAGGFDLTVSADSRRVYVTGMTTVGRTYSAGLVLAYDAATGQRLWSAKYKYPASSRTWFREIEVSPSGDRVYASGDSDRVNPSQGGVWIPDVATVTYDAATGAQLKIARFTTSTDPGVTMIPSHGPNGSELSGDGARLYIATVVNDGYARAAATYADLAGAGGMLPESNVADLALLAYDTR